MRTLVGLVVLVLAACGGSGPLPRLQIPQLQQAHESVKGGIGKRYEEYGVCRKQAADAKTLVACMDGAGYDYVPRSAEGHAMECWRLRDWNVTDPLPDEQCFLRKQAPER
jgi:hypothetical protein